jgi:hypothetical protein
LTFRWSRIVLGSRDEYRYSWDDDEEDGANIASWARENLRGEKIIGVGMLEREVE